MTDRAPVAAVARELGLSWDTVNTIAMDASGRPRLGEHQPIRDLPVAVFVAPLAEHVGKMRDTGAQDERQPGRLSGRPWLALEIVPASATTVTSAVWWAALKALTTGSVVAVSALLPSNASTVSGNPAASVSRPRVICGSRRLSLKIQAHGTHCRHRSRSTASRRRTTPGSLAPIAHALR
jgi:hypothetical protein